MRRLLPSVAPATSQNWVSMGPGHTAHTLMPRGRSSSWRALEKASTKDLVAAYTDILGVGAKAAMEATFTTRLSSNI